MQKHLTHVKEQQQVKEMARQQDIGRALDERVLEWLDHFE